MIQYFLFFFIACHSDSKTSVEAPDSPSTISVQSASDHAASNATAKSNSTSSETKSDEGNAIAETSDAATDRPDNTKEDSSTQTERQVNSSHKATNDIGAQKIGSPNATGDVFIGYNHLGEKGSLPNRCVLCRRMNTPKEVRFLKKCRAQGGETHSCYCITQLCSVKIEMQ
ncbi:MAG: hypothetical protein VX278_04100 [Myxococcota bacterium]|nr:hypothetical protein [Myxococcota bacterium]